MHDAAINGDGFTDHIIARPCRQINRYARHVFVVTNATRGHVFADRVSRDLVPALFMSDAKAPGAMPVTKMPSFDQTRSKASRELDHLPLWRFGSCRFPTC
jgi:hypothetical protein